MRIPVIAVAAAACIAFFGATARADGLSAGEMDRLLRGATVTRPQSLVQNRRQYVGGVAYSIVDAPADRITDVLAGADGWRQVLPSTRSARRVGSVSGDSLVEITHGSALIHATYTVRVRRDAREFRFWMDPTRPHDIEDVWGFLRAEPMGDGRSLVTFGVLIDMGPGLLRDLFESRVRNLALSVPARVRWAMLERNAIGRRASR